MLHRIVCLAGLIAVLVCAPGSGAVAVAAAVAAAPAAPLALTIEDGPVGTSYDYAGQLGFTKEAYLDDPNYLNHPLGLYVDGADNLFVAEYRGHRVVKIDAAGQGLWAVGAPGVCDAGLNQMCRGVDAAVDAAGNLWALSDKFIQKYAPDGAPLLSKPPDPLDHEEHGFEFIDPRGLAIDGSGRLFIANTSVDYVQVYSISGADITFLTEIGIYNGGSGDGEFRSPQGLAVDSSNRLYVADSGNQRIQRCAEAGGWTCATWVGGYPVANPPARLALRDDTLYVLAHYLDGGEPNDGRIQRCTLAGVCADVIAHLGYLPGDLAVDSHGNIYVSDSEHDVVRRYDAAGQQLDAAWAGAPDKPYITDNYHYHYPHIALDGDENRIIVEENGHRVVKLAKNGAALWSFGEAGVPGSDTAHLHSPTNAAADAAGNIYVANASDVRILSPGGQYLGAIGTGAGSGDYQFRSVTDVAVAPDGNIYVADKDNQRVQVFAPDRSYLDTLGVTGVSGSDNDHFYGPAGVGVDLAGNIYVADEGNGRVQKFDARRAYLASYDFRYRIGDVGYVYYDHLPSDVTIDRLGRQLVTLDSHSVVIIDPAGQYLTTIGGGIGDGPGQFFLISSVAVDADLKIYAGDGHNGRVQIFAPTPPGWQRRNLDGFSIHAWIRAAALEVFQNQLYAAGTSIYDMNDIHVWRSADGLHWSQAALLAGPDAHPYLVVVGDLAVYQGQLYLAASGGPAEPRLYRSPDGAAWSPVVADSFTPTTLAVYGERLYVGTQDATNGAQIWRSLGGAPGSWQAAASGGLGDTHANRVTSLAEFDGQLYAAVGVAGGPAQIWRSADGLAWSRATTGMAWSAASDTPGGLAVFGGALYLGLNHGAAGAEIWRSADGLHWSRVASGGWGDAHNTGVEGLRVLGHLLYAAVANDETGMEMWASADGVSWSQVNRDGFGEANNRPWMANAGLAVFQERLFVGALNDAHGAEVWMREYADLYLPQVWR